MPMRIARYLLFTVAIIAVAGCAPIAEALDPDVAKQAEAESAELEAELAELEAEAAIEEISEEAKPTKDAEPFMAGQATHTMDAEFTFVSGDCSGALPSFTETIETEIDGVVITLRNDNMGITSAGAIDSDGSFEAMISDYESYIGNFYEDWSGEADYLYIDENGCVTEYRVTFSSRE